MFKKGILVTVLASFVILVVGCGNAETSNTEALSLLQKSHEAMEDVTSMITEFDAEISVNAGFMSMDMPMSGRTYISANSDTDISMATMTTMSMMGMDMEMEMYFRDGYMYIDADGFRMKEPMDLELALEEMATSGVNVDFDLNEDWINSMSAEAVGSGHRLTFELNMEALAEVMGPQGDVLGLGLDDTDALGDVDIRSFVLTIYIDENYIQTSTQMQLDMSIEAEGIEMEMTMNMTSDIIQIDDVIIDFPAWLDEL